MEDLEAAMEDDRMPRLLLPHSDAVKSHSLMLYLDAYQYAGAWPAKVDKSRREAWRSTAGDLASQLSSSLSNWDGAAHALAYCRASKQVAVADALESRIEDRFARLQTIRGLNWFVSRNYQGFERELKTARVFTKHTISGNFFPRRTSILSMAMAKTHCLPPSRSIGGAF
jgi:hypothetical protein